MDNNYLEERIKKIELVIERTKAVTECQNQLSKYSWLHTAGMHKECVDLFTSHTPGSKVEMTWGVYEGFDAAEKCYARDHIAMEGQADSRKGDMHMHTLTTPIIEVAGNAKTAKGVWISPGIETGRSSGELNGSWCWIKYAADFCKEDGKWKIWHLHVYDIFTCPYDKSWVECNENVDFTKTDITESWAQTNRPDKSPTTHWSYSPDAIYPIDKPWVPFPYETWDDSLSY